MKIENILCKSDIAEILQDAADLKDDDISGAILILLRGDMDIEYHTTTMADADAVLALEVVKNQIIGGN